MSGDVPILPDLWECGQCGQLTHESHFYEDRATGLMAHVVDPAFRAMARERCGWRFDYDCGEPARCSQRHGHGGLHSTGIHGYGPFSSGTYGTIPPAGAVADGCIEATQ